MSEENREYCHEAAAHLDDPVSAADGDLEQARRQAEELRNHLKGIEFEVAKVKEYIRLIESGEVGITEKLYNYCRDWMRIHCPARLCDEAAGAGPSQSPEAAMPTEEGMAVGSSDASDAKEED